MFASKILAGQAFVRITGENLVGPALDRVRNQLRTFSNNVRRIGADIQAAGLGLTVFGASVSAGLGAAIRAASTATETTAAFGGVFQDLAPQAEESVQRIALAFRRAETDVRKFQIGFFSFLRGAGFNIPQSQELTNFLTRGAFDFASRFEVPDQEAFERFLSGLAGSSEVFARFGIAIRRANLNQALSELGIDKTVEQATELEKITARIQILQKTLGEDVQNILGDVARTQNEFANQLKSVQAAIKETLEDIGLPLTQALAPILGNVRNVIQGLAQLAQANPDITRTFAQVVAAVTATGTSMLALGVALRVLPGLFGLATTPIRVFLRTLISLPDLILFPVTRIVTGVTGILRGVVGTVRRTLLGIATLPTTLLRGVASLFRGLTAPITGFVSAIRAVRQQATAFARSIRSVFRTVSAPILFVGRQLISLGSLVARIPGAFGTAFGAITSVVGRATQVLGVFVGAIGSVFSVVSRVLLNPFVLFTLGSIAAVRAFVEFRQEITSGFRRVVSVTRDFGVQARDAIVRGVTGITSDIGTLFNFLLGFAERVRVEVGRSFNSIFEAISQGQFRAAFEVLATTLRLVIVQLVRDFTSEFAGQIANFVRIIARSFNSIIPVIFDFGRSSISVLENVGGSLLRLASIALDAFDQIESAVQNTTAFARGLIDVFTEVSQIIGAIAGVQDIEPEVERIRQQSSPNAFVPVPLGGQQFLQDLGRQARQTQVQVQDAASNILNFDPLDAERQRQIRNEQNFLRQLEFIRSRGVEVPIQIVAQQLGFGTAESIVDDAIQQDQLERAIQRAMEQRTRAVAAIFQDIQSEDARAAGRLEFELNSGRAATVEAAVPDETRVQIIPELQDAGIQSFRDFRNSLLDSPPTMPIRVPGTAEVQRQLDAITPEPPQVQLPIVPELQAAGFRNFRDFLPGPQTLPIEAPGASAIAQAQAPIQEAIQRTTGAIASAREELARFNETGIRPEFFQDFRNLSSFSDGARGTLSRLEVQSQRFTGRVIRDIDDAIQQLNRLATAEAESLTEQLRAQRRSISQGELGRIVLEARAGIRIDDRTFSDEIQASLDRLGEVVVEGTFTPGDLTALQNALNGLSIDNVFDSGEVADLVTRTELGSILNNLQNPGENFDPSVLEPTSEVRNALNAIGVALDENFDSGDFAGLGNLLRDAQVVQDALSRLDPGAFEAKVTNPLETIVNQLGFDLRLFRNGTGLFEDLSDVNALLRQVGEQNQAPAQQRQNPTLSAIDLLSSQGSRLIADSINRRDQPLETIAKDITAIRAVLAGLNVRQSIDDAIDIQEVNL